MSELGDTPDRPHVANLDAIKDRLRRHGGVTNVDAYSMIKEIEQLRARELVVPSPQTAARSVFDRNYGDEYGGPDWSYQRRIATGAIHALGCLGWDDVEGTNGGRYHLCRSRAGNVCAALYQEKQLVPDDFRNPAAVSPLPETEQTE